MRYRPFWPSVNPKAEAPLADVVIAQKLPPIPAADLPLITPVMLPAGRSTPLIPAVG